MALMGLLDLKDLPEQTAPMVLLGRKDPLVLQVLLDHKVPLDPLVLQVLLDRKDLPEQTAPMVLLGRKDPLVQTVRMVLLDRKALLAP